MKRKFIITEVVSYAVEADSAAQAEQLFEDAPSPDVYFSSSSGREIEAGEPNPVKVGEQVNVDAHAEHAEDFSGVVVDLATGGNIMVEAPDGVIYGCDPGYVYAPSPNEPTAPEAERPKTAEKAKVVLIVEGGVAQAAYTTEGVEVVIADYDNLESEGFCRRDRELIGEHAVEGLTEVTIEEAATEGIEGLASVGEGSAVV